MRTILFHAFFLLTSLVAVAVSEFLLFTVPLPYQGMWMILLAANVRSTVRNLHDLVEYLYARARARRSTWAIHFAIEMEPPAVRPFIRQLVREFWEGRWSQPITPWRN